MRFHSDGPSIPDLLLEQCDAGRVVFLCGAGVSFNSGMPTFLGLTKHVIDFFSPSEDSPIMRAFNPWLDDASTATVSLDQIFTLLHQEYGAGEVNALVARRLEPQSDATNVGYEHGLIKRISSNLSGDPQIVTTNFDRLFEHGEKRDGITSHVPPAFPDLALGMRIEGVTYLHGRLASTDGGHLSYVLSSADFGRAYLAEAWATKFVCELLKRYTVVLVGYQAEDPPLKYLLQGLNRSDQFDQSQLFAFDRGEPKEIENKWSDRGVTSIAYREHAHLWQTMEAWADRADEPRNWRCKVVEGAKRDPKEMLPYQRGQVAHVLRSVPGAKLFVETKSPPHPEWICVFDASIRSVKKCGGYGDNAETFEPMKAYGLDDDNQHSNFQENSDEFENDHLLQWRDGDDNPSKFHRIGGRQVEGGAAISTRLNHLILWIVKLRSSPVIAWWAARQRGLHPRLIYHLESYLYNENEIDERCRHVWNYILEHHRDSQNRETLSSTWHFLRRRISKEGWPLSVLRQFRRVSQPRLIVELPKGVHMCRPPASHWRDLPLDEIFQFNVKHLHYGSESFDIADEAILAVFEILENHLKSAEGMLSNIKPRKVNTPTCYPDRESDGGRVRQRQDGQFSLFVKVFDRLVTINADRAKVHVSVWSERDQHFFRKLKLYALSKVDLFDANEMASIIVSFDQNAFWDVNVVRELLFAIVDRWSGISMKNKEAIVERILAGPNGHGKMSKEKKQDYRNMRAAAYGRYLQLEGCNFSKMLSIKLNEIIAEIPRWNDERARAIVKLQGSNGGFVETMEDPDVLLGLKPSDIVPRAEADIQASFSSLEEKRPFKGLVKSHPRRALAALTAEARKGSYPSDYWSDLMNEFPRDISSRLFSVFLKRLVRLPYVSVAELRYTASNWLLKNLNQAVNFDNNLGWRVYDHFFDGILTSGGRATASGIRQSTQEGKVAPESPSTYFYAVNGPIGKCAEAVLSVVLSEELKAGSQIPGYFKMRLEQLLAIPGTEIDHVVSILMSKLNQVMRVDPSWANYHLVPLLSFERSVAEPAWSGFFCGDNHLSVDVAPAIKPLLLELYPWFNQFEGNNDVSEIAVAYLGGLCIFHQNKPGGLKDREMRGIIREMNSSARNQLINWLSNVGVEKTDGWTTFIIPFIDNVWPRELKFRTSDSAVQWIMLLENTEDDFSIVFEVIKKFLIPIDIDKFAFSSLFYDVREERPIAARHPKAALDLIDTLMPEKLTTSSEYLSHMLKLIVEADPRLAFELKFRRLIDLVEGV